MALQHILPPLSQLESTLRSADYQQAVQTKNVPYIADRKIELKVVQRQFERAKAAFAATPDAAGRFAFSFTCIDIDYRVRAVQERLQQFSRKRRPERNDLNLTQKQLDRDCRQLIWSLSSANLAKVFQAIPLLQNLGSTGARKGRYRIVQALDSIIASGEKPSFTFGQKQQLLQLAKEITTDSGTDAIHAKRYIARVISYTTTNSVPGDASQQGGWFAHIAGRLEILLGLAVSLGKTSSSEATVTRSNLIEACRHACVVGTAPVNLSEHHLRQITTIITHTGNNDSELAAGIRCHLAEVLLEGACYATEPSRIGAFQHLRSYLCTLTLLQKFVDTVPEHVTALTRLSIMKAVHKFASHSTLITGWLQSGGVQLTLALVLDSLVSLDQGIDASDIHLERQVGCFAACIVKVIAIDIDQGRVANFAAFNELVRLMVKCYEIASRSIHDHTYSTVVDLVHSINLITRAHNSALLPFVRSEPVFDMFLAIGTYFSQMVGEEDHSDYIIAYLHSAIRFFPLLKENSDLIRSRASTFVTKTLYELGRAIRGLNKDDQAEARQSAFLLWATLLQNGISNPLISACYTIETSGQLEQIVACFNEARDLPNRVAILDQLLPAMKHLIVNNTAARPAFRTRGFVDGLLEVFIADTEELPEELPLPLYTNLFTLLEEVYKSGFATQHENASQELEYIEIILRILGALHRRLGNTPTPGYTPLRSVAGRFLSLFVDQMRYLDKPALRQFLVHQAATHPVACMAFGHRYYDPFLHKVNFCGVVCHLGSELTNEGIELNVYTIQLVRGQEEQAFQYLKTILKPAMRLRISFIGEPGVDEGALVKDFLETVLTSAFFREEYGEILAYNSDGVVAGLAPLEEGVYQARKSEIDTKIQQFFYLLSLVRKSHAPLTLPFGTEFCTALAASYPPLAAQSSLADIEALCVQHRLDITEEFTQKRIEEKCAICAVDSPEEYRQARVDSYNNHRRLLLVAQQYLQQTALGQGLQLRGHGAITCPLLRNELLTVNLIDLLDESKKLMSFKSATESVTGVQDGQLVTREVTLASSALVDAVRGWTLDFLREEADEETAVLAKWCKFVTGSSYFPYGGKPITVEVYTGSATEPVSAFACFNVFRVNYTKIRSSIEDKFTAENRQFASLQKRSEAVGWEMARLYRSLIKEQLQYSLDAFTTA